jgi:hypothetical protein
MQVAMVNQASLAALRLRATPKSDQALLVSACETADGKPAQIFVVISEQILTAACGNPHAF